MGGVYGEINSRSDFHRVLREARAITGKILAQRPDNDTIEVIDTQLDAMERWTANGREPTAQERETINVGLLAARELDAAPDEQSQILKHKLYALNNYFEDWPTDDQAKNATDDDFFDA